MCQVNKSLLFASSIISVDLRVMYFIIFHILTLILTNLSKFISTFDPLLHSVCLSLLVAKSVIIVIYSSIERFCYN
jgi:hypothetical protein